MLRVDCVTEVGTWDEIPQPFQLAAFECWVKRCQEPKPCIIYLILNMISPNLVVKSYIYIIIYI